MKYLFNKLSIFSLVLIVSFSSLSCKSANKQQAETKTVEEPQVKAPTFNQDSAYLYVKKQVDFGARVPNTPPHKACAKYLVAELHRFGAEVIEQKANLIAYDKTALESDNIIGSYNSSATTRIVLFAHWDCRPFADHDPNPKNYHTPVMGANDAASGVGVLLEMARLMGKQSPTVGVDIIFLDSEDYGQPSFDKSGTEEESQDSWCLGAQYWAKNPHKENYRARYGVLLDMVGAFGATFPKEKMSMTYAPAVVDKIWNKAEQLGFGNIFVNKPGGSIIDDHLYVNEIIGIPCVDIIHFSDSGFPDHWHTINDTMVNIDKNTLNAVGQTLLEVIYAER